MHQVAVTPAQFFGPDGEGQAGEPAQQGAGGFEWTAGPGTEHLVGITALEVDADGLITAITSVYDSRQIDPASKRSLVEPSAASAAWARHASEGS